jgi:formyltetrahydrofolate deformylase
VFFTRVEWTPAADDPESVARFEAAFAAELATPCAMRWRLERASRRLRMAVFVSKSRHCLYDILSRWQSGEWDVEIPLVVSNHPDLGSVAERHGIRFEHVPVTREGKAAAERRQLELLREERVDLVVLARYMQILSADFIAAMPERVMNIHHSFLPAFAGAQPYHAAFARGAKVNKQGTFSYFLFFERRKIGECPLFIPRLGRSVCGRAPSVPACAAGSTRA